MLPNFLIVGTAKAGTTALYEYLRQHPQIYMSPVKETNFFIFEDRPVAFGGPKAEQLSREYAVTDLREYEAQFGNVSDEIAVGEASPWYLYTKQTAGRIRRRIPDAKLIVVLRDPVERAFSSYLHCVREGTEELTFKEGLRAERSRIEAGWEFMWHYREAGFYSSQVQRYLDVFSEEQIKLILYEDLNDDISLCLKQIYTFLGVDEEFRANTSMRPNATGLTGNKLLEKLWLKPNPVKSVARRILPQKLRYEINHRAYQLLLKKPVIEAEVRKELQDEYREDVQILEGMLGLNLSRWYSS